MVNILRSDQIREANHQKYLIYGMPSSDADENVKDTIALLTEHGIEVEFQS